MARPRGSTHDCPHCDAPNIPNRLLACRVGWYLLPTALRDEVYATAHLSVLDPARRDVLTRCVAIWRATDGQGLNEVTAYWLPR
jgi:hypothetical protein